MINEITADDPSASADDEPKKKRSRARWKRGVHPTNRVYHHPRRDEIEVDLAVGISTRVLMAKYGVNDSTLRRWKRTKMSARMKEQVRKAMAIEDFMTDDEKIGKIGDYREGYKAKVQRRIHCLEDAMARALAMGDLKTYGYLSNCLARYDETEGKMLGVLDQTTIKNEINIKNQDPAVDLSGLSVEELEILNAMSEKLTARQNNTKRLPAPSIPEADFDVV